MNEIKKALQDIDAYIIVNDNNLARNGYTRIRVVIGQERIKDREQRRVAIMKVQEEIARKLPFMTCEIGEPWEDYGATTTHALVRAFDKPNDRLAKMVIEYGKQNAYYERLDDDDPLKDILYHELRGMAKMIEIMRGEK